MLRFHPLVYIALLASPLWAQEGRRLALVIGISGYNDHIGQLPRPLDDARSIGKALEQDGFRVTLLLDTTHAELLQGLKSFTASVQRGDIAFVYYAGHGVQVSGANFILPRDFSGSSADLDAKAIRLDEVIQSLNDRGPKLKILVFDACRNNPFGSGREGLAEMQAAAYGPGTYIAMSAAPNQLAQDGLVAGHLVTALEVPGLSIGGVFIQVRNGVLRDSGNRQDPFSTDLQLEEFYFVPRHPDASPVQPSKHALNSDLDGSWNGKLVRTLIDGDDILRLNAKLTFTGSDFTGSGYETKVGTLGISIVGKLEGNQIQFTGSYLGIGQIRRTVEFRGKLDRSSNTIEGAWNGDAMQNGRQEAGTFQLQLNSASPAKTD